jgi:DnaJ family protein C protein 14
LGIRSDSSDETIRRYYKKQAVQVHPDKNVVIGAEEAFKILGKAFEMIGETSKRTEYHNKLLEAHAKEQVYGEIGKLLEQLRKKMEIATSSIRFVLDCKEIEMFTYRSYIFNYYFSRCTKCNLRHKKNKTDRPLFAARYCSQCNIHHGAREVRFLSLKRFILLITFH